MSEIILRPYFFEHNWLSICMSLDMLKTGSKELFEKRAGRGEISSEYVPLVLKRETCGKKGTKKHGGSREVHIFPIHTEGSDYFGTRNEYQLQCASESLTLF